MPARPIPDFGHQPLEAGPVDRGGARLAQVRIDHDHAVARPAERDGSLPQRILPLGALGILEHLSHRRLAHIQVGVAREVPGGDLLRRVHGLIASGRRVSAMVASPWTRPIRSWMEAAV
jgi:hypothetical protein